MTLTKEQVKEYREKLKNSEYIKKGVYGLAGKLMEVTAPAEKRGVILNINKTEEKMAKNKLSDLNDHLMETIEWLTDRTVKGEELTEQIRRSEAVGKVAAQVIANANLVLKACVAKDNSNGKFNFPLIEDKS